MKKSSIINCINLLLGIFLAFLLLTDIELNSTLANFLFPVFVLIFACVSYKKIMEKQKGKILFYLPSFICGFGFCVVIILFLLLNLLGSFFWFSEETHKSRIQKTYSPNKIEYCEVYHYPVGAYSGGTGRDRIFLVNKFFPVLRKEVFYESKSYVWIEDENDIPYDYFSWKDSETIVVGDEEIDVYEIEFYPAEIIKNIN